ncbi:conjugal transfer pilus assembly protein TraK [Sphingobium sp. B1D7B]|uniref:type-F conjugative transfer system secretin TraK n=1 Tax=Sphingobium sp. B1D7B TaxID=2940578 RepID=UPI002224F851|nr:type-F conjugative transfer system secretin TraK [Sphingobium sp. B1D7B]MCW2406894.1 conjugal transfer pilus assembly protein TraK [Sphingobium sp. B1D7B]
MTRKPNRALALGLSAISLCAASPAWADQQFTVEDNDSVRCTVASRELTRVSLVDDAFASVSKTETLDPRDDFSVVNEPTRGDIYISVPDGFRPGTLSFFGTSKKGFVYKFACKVAAVEAQQVFLTNTRAFAPPAPDAQALEEEAPDLDEAAVRLIQGMAGQQVMPGYRLSRSALAPVQVGTLTVQLIAEYQGLDQTGRVLRIENKGNESVVLDESAIAPAGAHAVSISRPQLAAREATAAYVVVANEQRR